MYPESNMHPVITARVESHDAGFPPLLVLNQASAQIATNGHSIIDARELVGRVIPTPCGMVGFTFFDVPQRHLSESGIDLGRPCNQMVRPNATR